MDAAKWQPEGFLCNIYIFCAICQVLTLVFVRNTVLYLLSKCVKLKHGLVGSFRPFVLTYCKAVCYICKGRYIPKHNIFEEEKK